MASNRRPQPGVPGRVQQGPTQRVPVLESALPRHTGAADSTIPKFPESEILPPA